MVAFGIVLLLVVALFNAGIFGNVAIPTGLATRQTQQMTQPTPQPARIVVDAESDSLLLELRRQYLDDRAQSINQWLAAIAFILGFVTLFVTGLGIAGGIIGYRRLNSIRDEAEAHRGEARQSAGQAQEAALNAAGALEQIRTIRNQAQRELDDMRRSTAKDAPSPEIMQILAYLVSDPNEASDMDRATLEAFTLQRQKDTEAAIGKWRFIANSMEGEDDKRAARAWFSAGYLYGDNHESAIGAYNEAIRLDRNLAAAYYNRGFHKDELGDYDGAIADCTLALDLDPLDAEGFNNRGAAYFHRGRMQEAKADFDAALRLSPHDAEYRCNRAEVEVEMGQFAQALTDATLSIEQDLDLAAPHYHRGRAQLALGNRSEALSDFTKARELAERIGDNDIQHKAEQSLSDFRTTE